MVEVVPFRATRYTKKAGALSKVIAPPYDIIEEPLRKELAARSKYNIIHLTRPRPYGKRTRYQQASRTLARWLKSGILAEDTHSAYYAYEQEFPVGGRKLTRTGLCALVRVGPPKGGKGAGGGSSPSIVPHETTRECVKADRLKLVRATRSNLEPILLMYPDANRYVEKLLIRHRPERVRGAKSADGTHRIWPVTNADTIRRIRHFFTSARLFIADGHHRYETSLACAEKLENNAGAKYRLAKLVGMSCEGLVVLPAHRLAKGIRNFDAEVLLSMLEDDFLISGIPGARSKARKELSRRLRRHAASGDYAFGLYTAGGTHHLLMLKENRLPPEAMLDTEILADRILRGVLGLSAAGEAPEEIEYIGDLRHEVSEAMRAVDEGKAQALFLLNPTNVQEIRRYALAGRKMPGKTTYFYPKAYAGLLFYRFSSVAQPK